MSSLFQKIGSRLVEAHKTHAKDETTPLGQMDLPRGIKNGIAKIVEARFGEYKSGDVIGQPFVFMSAVVMSPTEHAGMKIAGLRTNFTEPLCDTPDRKQRATFDEHMAYFYNLLRNLGVETDKIDPTQLEKVLDDIQKAGILIQFETNGKDPTPAEPSPKVYQNWIKRYDGSNAEAVENFIQDDTAVDVPTIIEEPATPAAPPSSSTTNDLETLANLAAGNDSAAIAKIVARATAAGISQEEIDESPSWQDLCHTINLKEQAPPVSAPASPKEFKKGDAVRFKNEANGEVFEAQITAIFPDKGTANVKILKNGSIIKSVPVNLLS